LAYNAMKVMLLSPEDRGDYEALVGALKRL